ncbi:MAG: Rrf2 family transcriptional regulator [Gemmatimonadota bacterium]|nr:Rrf2 family transcriptional regulator [Gemmatimonadota bacterium]
MLSQTAEYALRAAVYLAELHGSGPTRVDDIAEGLGVPRNYLSKILHTLAKAGLLSSTRGPSGGFELVRPPGETPLLDVVRHFDPALASESSACLLGREACRDDDPCGAHERWGSVRRQVQSFFEDTTLAHLVTREPATRTG